VDRRPGISVRLKLTLTYVGFLLIANALLMVAVWLFLLRGHAGLFTFPRMADFQRALDPHDFGPHVFVPSAIMVLTFLLLFGVIGGWVLAGRVLDPLAQITTATRKTASGSLDHRIDMDGRKDEFRELADSFDAMLARLEAHAAGQQRFVANASHELRTPLAITQALLDIARIDPDQHPDELNDRLRTVNARAIALTEALLALSRAEQHSFPSEEVDLSLVAEEAAETLLPLAERNGVTVATFGDITVASGSPALLLQMVTNLIHNAIVHNLPNGGTVWVETLPGTEFLTLTVKNTGEVIPNDVIATLAEPFQRGSERTHTDHAGFGLGLAIVTSIVKAHSGRLAMTSPATGGLSVSVQLPVHPATPPATSSEH
jgi:two-component system sensor histidine kinase VanS